MQRYTQKFLKNISNFFEKYGDVSVIPTRYFLFKPRVDDEMIVDVEAGKRLIIKLLTVGPVRPNGKRDVFFELNGEPRTIEVLDMHAGMILGFLRIDFSIATEHVEREKAQVGEPGDVGAPMAGVVVEVRVKQGACVSSGDPLCVLSAMKMETLVTAPVSGR